MIEEYQWMTTEELISTANSKRVQVCTNRRELILRLLIKHDYGKMKIGELRQLASDAGLNAKNTKYRLVEDLTGIKMFEITGNSDYLMSSSGEEQDVESSEPANREKTDQQKTQDKELIIHRVLMKGPGRTKLKGNLGKGDYLLQVYTICSVCGEEVYGAYKAQTNTEPAEQIATLSAMFRNCPNCGKKLGLIADRYIESYQTAGPQAQFKELHQKIEAVEKDRERKHLKELLESVEPKEDLPPNNNAAQIVLSSLDKLKEYILHLIHMESEVYLLSERFVSLQLQEADNEKSKARARAILSEDKQKKIQNTTKKLTDSIEELNYELKKADDAVTEESIIDLLSKTGLFKPEKPSIIKPAEPLAPVQPTMEKPVEPQYKQPGLFNKKKILAENEALKRKYEDDQATYTRLLLAYDQARARYEKDLETYPSRLSRYENAQRQYASELKAYNTAFAEAKIKAIQAKKLGIRETITKKEEELKNAKRSLGEDEKQRLKTLPQVQISGFLAEERSALLKELKRVISGRDELYSYNIIYGKYRSFVALTSLYEYLDSGRCSSLDGPQGAYNLFESESRTNEIILQLSTIAASLESIKANQFMLYKELKMANQNLSEINDSTHAVIKELRTVGDAVHGTASQLSSIASDVASNSMLLSDIRKTTAITAVSSTATAFSSAKAAHYAALNAHYSRVNAELTDALGYMIALQ